MASNPGKRFEEDFAKSVPDYCMLHRLKDSAQAYNNSRKTLFTWDNPCDFFLLDDKSGLFYTIECKTTKYKSMSVQLAEEDSDTSMIKKHQIDSLKGFTVYNKVVPGFLLNFRHFDDEKEKYFETTYFQHIDDFLHMMDKIGKKSFNELDLLTVGNVVKVNGNIKRTRYTWDIDEFLMSKCNDKGLKIV